jgi:HPt (histidine-containing phosphotransfer) domain-containing protein
MLDFDALNAYLDNDEEIIYAVLSTYQEDHGNSLEEIEELVQQKNWAKLHFTVHTLKGLLASFGEETATVALERIEQNTVNNLAPQEDDLSVIYREIRIINRQIDEVLSTY